MEQQISIEEALRNQNHSIESAINRHAALSPQNKDILEALQRGQILTGAVAYEQIGTMKLASRCSELRRAGYVIHDRWVTLPSGKKIKEYFL